MVRNYDEDREIIRSFFTNYGFVTDVESKIFPYYEMVKRCAQRKMVNLSLLLLLFIYTNDK